MVIYDIDGNKLLDAILTEGAEHEQELSKSDFVKLSWESNVKITIPSGSYIIPFEDSLKFRLLNAYIPSETDKGFRYDVEFHHPLMLLCRIPFLYVENELKQQEWSFDGLTVSALEYVCKAINEAFVITDESKKFTYTLCGTVDGSVSFSVSSNDILSVLSSIAQACKDNNCEWHLDWEHHCLYFGQIAINLGEKVPLLKVHDNIQTAMVSESKEDYYNCFYPQGSTKNMSRKAQVGTGNVATLARLGLDMNKYPDGCIYVGMEGKIITKAEFEGSNAIKQMLALSFDGIFPHINLYAYNIRKRTRWLKNEQTKEWELDSNGNKKKYTVWYMRLAYCTTTKDTSKTLVNTTIDKDEQGNTVTHYWYDYDLDSKKQVLQGYSLKGMFKVNTHTTNNKYDALNQSLVGQPSGQEGFELYYHDVNETLPVSAATGDSGISVLKGDYEIVMYHSGDNIIPSNEDDGLIPHGKILPDLTCNIVILFNIVMGEHETKLAQEELALRTIKTIADRTKDKNNYSILSNPVEFSRNNPNLYIGQKVIYDDGFGYQLTTRVIKLITKLDYPIIQNITVGNQAIKGTISQLKEDVSNILTGNFSGCGLNNSQVSDIVKNYVGNRFLRKDTPDTAQQLITFLEGLLLGDGKHGITEKGVATLLKVITDNIESRNFEKGILGNGFGMWTDADGRSYAEFDYLDIRRAATFRNISILELKHIGGELGLTAGAMQVSKVERLGGIYRCYFDTTDGKRTVYQEFVAGDQARCQQFRPKADKSGMLTTKYYWRLVTAVGNDYIDLSISDCDTGSSEPEVGDNIIQLGYRGTDHPERQSAVILSAVAFDAPSQKFYQGINSYNLTNCLAKDEGYDSSTGVFQTNVYGNAYIGNKDVTDFFEYKNGKATFSGEAHFKQGSTGGENIQGILTSGANLILNSGFCGNYKTKELAEDTLLKEQTELYSPSMFGWNGDADVREDSDSMSGFSVAIKTFISQFIKMGIIPGDTYSFTCKAKGSSLTVRIGGAEKSFSLTNDYQIIKMTCTPTAGNVLELIGPCDVCEPMLVAGNTQATWQRSPLDVDRAFDIQLAMSYLTDALANDTRINGGLLLSTLIKVGRLKNGKWKDAAGMSGIYNDDNDVAFYAGGTFEDAIRTVMTYMGNPTYHPTDEELQAMAKYVVTHGGRTILNDAILRGIIYADGGILRNIRTPNGSLVITEDGNVSIVGKFETSLNGKKITIDPDLGRFTLSGERTLSDGSKVNADHVVIDINDLRHHDDTFNYVPNVSCFDYHPDGNIRKITSVTPSGIYIEGREADANSYATYDATGMDLTLYDKLSKQATTLSCWLIRGDSGPIPYIRSNTFPTYDQAPVGGVYLSGDVLKVKLK